MELSRLINAFAQEKGIIAGVCGTEIIYDEESVNQAGAPFIHYSREQRQNPANLLKNAQSIIVIGAGYNRKPQFKPDGCPRGLLSLGAVGLDYHINLRNILVELEHRIREGGYVFDSHISVDTGPLPEKRLAVRAGLGWIGRNRLVISDAFGSFFNIGYMITTLRIEPSSSAFSQANNSDMCDNCDMCVMECPTGALSVNENGEVCYDYKRCISYLTQKKGCLTDEERSAIGTRLYGCDICQNVCPHNQNTYVGKITSQDYIAPLLDDILLMTKADFAKRFKSTAIYWRGLETIKRNAEIALQNCNRNSNQNSSKTLNNLPEKGDNTNGV